MIMYKCFTTAFILGLILWSKCAAQITTPTMSMAYETGASISSPASVMFGNRIKFTCSFDALGAGENFYIYNVILQVLQSGGSYVSTAQCQFSSDPDLPREAKSLTNSVLNISTNDISCSPNNNKVEFTMELLLSKEENYVCLLQNIRSGESKPSSANVLKSYSKPEKPKILKDPASPKANDRLSISCTSSAYPAPKLRLLLDGIQQAVSDEAANSNSENLITQSSVVWELTADKKMHNKELKCEVDRAEHPHNEEVSTTQRLLIIYGPEVESTSTAHTFNIKSNEPMVLKCQMQGYPMITSYKWLSYDKKEIGTGANFTIDSSYYDNVSVWPHIVTFTCQGTNTNTSNSKEQRFTVTLTNTARSGTTGASIETTGKNGLKDWEIAVIVIAVVIVLAVIIGTVACVIKKKRDSSTSAKKSKAAQARRSSDDKSDARFHSSTASFGLHDSNRPGNYSENPTLPMDMRYSTGNVEQYAEALDDRPRSRKPIALDDVNMFEENGSTPYGEAPPAYTDMNPYRMEHGYPAYSPSYHGSTYGAAC